MRRSPACCSVSPYSRRQPRTIITTAHHSLTSSADPPSRQSRLPASLVTRSSTGHLPVITQEATRGVARMMKTVPIWASLQTRVTPSSPMKSSAAARPLATQPLQARKKSAKSASMTRQCLDQKASLFHLRSSLLRAPTSRKVSLASSTPSKSSLSGTTRSRISSSVITTGWRSRYPSEKSKRHPWHSSK